MTAIGGFLELELGAGGEPYHAGVPTFASGRACLRAMLEQLRPRRVWTPFYVCDSVVDTVRRAGAEIVYYGINAALDPLLPAGEPGQADCAIYVNYFGVKNHAAAAFASAHGEHAIVDDTQSFFQRGYPGAWSFNSARKFFGVPDGGYAFGDGLGNVARRPPVRVRYEHLISRLLGPGALAFDQYRESEACVSDEPVAMSALAERLLARVDYASARCARRDNFERLHARFGRRNGLTLTAGAAADGPYCYPLLADRAVPWKTFWDRQIFVPRLWPEVSERPAGAGAFTWERQLATHVLPLPVDHRYGSADMDRLAQAVDEVLAW
jgi:hypothetical protein